MVQNILSLQIGSLIFSSDEVILKKSIIQMKENEYTYAAGEIAGIIPKNEPCILLGKSEDQYVFVLTAMSIGWRHNSWFSQNRDH